MNRTLLSDSPFLLGFDHTRMLIERAAKAAGEGYPPYNVEESGDGRVRITIAVAGFTPDQLAVTVEDNHLTISGKREPETETGERAFLHRGIAARGFVRSFVLADGMEVESASLEHGLLHVEAVRPEPARRVRQVPIRTAG
jgi:HSP20 family molecular chaperone IbpA